MSEKDTELEGQTESDQQKEAEARVQTALEFALEYGSAGGETHKAWVLDQMVRALTGGEVIDSPRSGFRNHRYTVKLMGESDEYREFIARHKAQSNVNNWSEGTEPRR